MAPKSKSKKQTKPKKKSGPKKHPQRSDMVGGSQAQLKATALSLRKRNNGKVHNQVDKYQITRPLREKIFADIQRIRQMWCQGSSDMQIRRELVLSHKQWRARVNIMRTVPPDEGVVNSFRRYQNQHERFTLRLESRLNKLTGLYDSANEELTLPVIGRATNSTETFKRKRDPREARRIQVQMAHVDESLRSGEEQLLAIKTQLGIIVPLASGEDVDDMKRSLFRSSNIKEIWRRRREKEKEIEVTAKEVTTKEVTKGKSKKVKDA